MSVVIEEVYDEHDYQPEQHAHGYAESDDDTALERAESFHDAGEATTDDEWQDVTEHFDASALSASSASNAAVSPKHAADFAQQDSETQQSFMQVPSSYGATGTSSDLLQAGDTGPPGPLPSAATAAQMPAESQSPVLLRPPDDFWENARSSPLRSEEYGSVPLAAADAAEDSSFTASELPDETAAAPPSGEIEILTVEETEKRTAVADALKAEGNRLFAVQEWQQAQVKYGAALDAAPPAACQRAIYFANRAACALKQRQWSDAVADCSAAVAIDADYVKAYLRRATAYEESDDLDRSLADYDKVCQLDPGNAAAKANAAKLRPVVEERREKMKEEMIGKLKELGNTVLGKFGMSVDNFKAVKGPDGGYSLSFQQ